MAAIFIGTSLIEAVIFCVQLVWTLFFAAAQTTCLLLFATMQVAWFSFLMAINVLAFTGAAIMKVIFSVLLILLLAILTIVLIPFWLPVYVTGKL